MLMMDLLSSLLIMESFFADPVEFVVLEVDHGSSFVNAVAN